MNAFNRVLVSALLLVILLLALCALGIATGLLRVQTVDAVVHYPPFHAALTDFHSSHPDEIFIRKILVAAGTALLAVLLLQREVPPARRERSLRLLQSRQGDVTISYRALRTTAELACRGVSGVHDARCDVESRQNALRVRCRVTIDRYANAAVVGTHVETAIKHHLEQALGNPVERVTVEVAPQHRDTLEPVR